MNEREVNESGGGKGRVDLRERERKRERKLEREKVERERRVFSDQFRSFLLPGLCFFSFSFLCFLCVFFHHR